MTTTAPARERLLTAAVEAFAEHGFGATTTRDIASRAGMSPAAVYVHHATKEQLLFAVSVQGHEQALTVIEAADAAGTDPVDRVRRMVHAFSHWHAEHSRVGRVVQYEFGALTPEHRAVVARLRRGIERCMRNALADGVDEGVLEVGDVKGAARAVLSLSIDLVRWFEPGGTRTAADLADLHADLAVRMVRPTRPAGPSGR
ncbi:transcriptional regulator, TetR family [Aeromicrobium marinum DSM 15272]|uniref:Transcriptional regulator, TetR family n=1 Tax=Aeromicrobium marinum DSM 15272 TaxID=585531 RepID=E2SBD1_9ACTN|nr:TetR/AcrR family transcriptional regulator [Aeromicrobium marinum]EFQ83677.1 transcriptional regulator, TetR family [Aeromicrobium marinum DSM 15272]